MYAGVDMEPTDKGRVVGRGSAVEDEREEDAAPRRGRELEEDTHREAPGRGTPSVTWAAATGDPDDAGAAGPELGSGIDDNDWKRAVTVK
jgi:hypothetical protein